MLSIHLFGNPTIQIEDRPVRLLRRKSRGLFYYLSASERPIHRDKLVSVFWPDLPRASAYQTLRTTLSGLRKELGEFIETEKEYVSLVGNFDVDSRSFEKCIAGNKFEPEQWMEVLDVYRGEFLEGIDLPDSAPFEQWAIVERERFRRLAMHGYAELSSYYEVQQDYQKALSYLNRALYLNPLQEDFQRESIRLLYLSGDRPGAIRRYDELRKLLDNEMGVPPMLETRRLYDAILTDRLSTTGSSNPGVARSRRANKTQRLVAEKIDETIPFVGRSQELSKLRQSLKENKFVLVDGEPGIGKTRLVDEYLTEFDGFKIIGRSYELEQTLPYQPFITIMRKILSSEDWQWLAPIIKEQVSEIWLAEVARLVPEIQSILSAHYPAESQVNETRLWEAVRCFLDAISDHRKTAVFLDDIHWADSTSISLLGYLVRHQFKAPISFVATSRPFSTRSPLVTLINNLSRLGRLEHITLLRLKNDEIHQIAEKLSKSKVNALANTLNIVSEGNPYILVEILRSIKTDQINDPKFEIDLNTLLSTPAVPRNIYNLIQSRLSNLTEPARRVLDVGVAIGRVFEFDVVFRAAGLSETAALDALDELIKAGLVYPSGDFQFSFDHHLTMEVAYQEIGDLRHRLLHRRVAEALESLHAEDTSSIASLLAWHFSEGHDFMRAGPYAYQAGQQASILGAWNEAIKFYEQALGSSSLSQRLLVYLALGEACQAAGRFVQASDAYREALKLAQEKGAGPGVDQKINDIRLKLARTYLPQARFVEAIEQARYILTGQVDRKSLDAELIWGTALSIEGAELEEGKFHLLSAKKFWEEIQPLDPSALAQIQFELGSLYAQQGDLTLAIQSYRDALANVQKEQGHPNIELLILINNNLAYHLHLLEDPTASTFATTGLELAKARGILGLQAYLYSTLGEIALAEHQPDLADKYFQQGLEIAEEFAVNERVAGLTANLGLVANQRGQTNLAIYRLSNALGLADSLGTRHLAAQIRLWLVPLLPVDEARMRLDEAKEIAEGSGRKRLLEQANALGKLIEY